MKKLLLLLIFVSSCAPSGEQLSPGATSSQQAIEANTPSNLQSDLMTEESQGEDSLAEGRSEQVIDPRCERDGCSGELCRVPAINEEENENSLCEWHEYYACYSIPSCTFKEDSCSWDVSPEFLSCLQEHQAPAEVMSQFSDNHVLNLISGRN